MDAIAFTGGIGEHSASTRARICHSLDFLGLNLDAERNQNAAAEVPFPIGAGSGERVWVVPTDEDRQIARETFALLNQPA